MFGNFGVHNIELSKWSVRPSLLAVIAGSLLGVGFVWPSLWWMSLAGIILSILFSLHSSSIRSVTLFFFLAWWVKYIFSFSFILSTYPLSWLGVAPGVWQLLMLGVFWLSCALWLAFGGLLTGILIGCVARYFKPGLLLTFPILWLLGEIAAPLFFSLFLFGDGGTINFNFSSGMIGYLFGYATTGIWLAAWYGVYGLTLLYVSIGVLLVVAVDASNQKKVLTAAIVALVFGIATVMIMNRSLPDREPVSVIALQTKFDNSFRPSEGQVTKTDLLHEAVVASLAFEADFLLTPEDSRYLNKQFGSMDDEANVKFARFFLPQTETIIIDSGSAQEADHSVLRGYIFDRNHSRLYITDKQYLVPQGEFVPYLYGALFTAVGFDNAIEKIKETLSYRPSQYNDQSEFPTVYPRIMFCFESLNPRSAYRLKNDSNVPFIAHPVSHAWFTEPEVLWQQQDIMLRIQARWSGVPIVKAGNMLQGKTYLPDGTVDYGTVIATGDRWEARLIRF
jgi:apolipoprotein N-acyltransferase